MKTQRIEVLYGFTNCYVISEEESGLCAVVDPGGNAEKIEKYIVDNALTLKYILLTHGHFDHTGAVSALRENHPDCVVYMNSADNIASDDKAIKKLFKPVNIAIEAKEGTLIRLGKIEIKVIETPGHSMGSVCYIAEDCIFSGDTLFASNVGRTDFYGGDDVQLANSLIKLYALKENYKVFPGHMKPTELETERKTNPFFENL